MQGAICRAFGLDLEADFPLHGLRPAAPGSSHPVRLHLADPEEVKRRFLGTGAKTLWTTVMDGGCEVSVERGRNGDHRIAYGKLAAFWLSPEAGELLCAPVQPERPEWRRFLLDTVLTVTSLVRGFEALHASAVESGGALLAVISQTGGGKTSVASELVSRGGRLFCDDILVLRRRLGSVIAHPGPALMNLSLSDAARRPPGARTLARIGDEAWIELERDTPQPVPVGAIFLLERSGGAPERVTALPSSPLPLLPHALATAMLRARERTRFELFADLAAGTRLFRLEADLTTTPARLAQMVEAAAEGSVPALSPAGP
jgi:hypothetical protein